MYMNFNVSTLAGIPAAVAFFYLSNRYVPMLCTNGMHCIASHSFRHLLICVVCGGREGSKVCHTDLMCHLPSQIFFRICHAIDFI